MVNNSFNNIIIELEEFLLEIFSKLKDYKKINLSLKEVCGISNFFADQGSIERFCNLIKSKKENTFQTKVKEYGDFQTNENLAKNVVKFVAIQNPDIEVIIEPTCGVGNFIISCLNEYKKLKKIIGIEIFEPYILETKLKILSYFLKNPYANKPEIEIINISIFDFDLMNLAKFTKNYQTLIIGNPPWATNSMLSSFESSNLPKKFNYKNANGLEALTGKSNFDLGESITYKILSYFDKHNGYFAFLVKNTVIKNLIFAQKKAAFTISNLQKYNINSKKEFNAAVDSSLFLAKLNSKPQDFCTEYNFYNPQGYTKFGWKNNKFVSSIENYSEIEHLDGNSIFEWRSGIKHDCSKVMELTKNNGYYKNSLGEKVKIENELVYNFLKSSDLKDDVVHSSEKVTIVTQKKIGQSTSYIKKNLPLTYDYLLSHKDFFDKRRSSIYKDKPQFSIFGIGDYSFVKYKIAISGLYKRTKFTLIDPSDSKPFMLDDTCYFIGFDNIKHAKIAHYVLNSNHVQDFLNSIIFFDSKRPITKDTLMRIDFVKSFELCEFSDAVNNIKNINFEDWQGFMNSLSINFTHQEELFI